MEINEVRKIVPVFANVRLSTNTPNIVPIARQNTNNTEQHSGEDIPCEETDSSLPTDQNEPHGSTSL